jgi:hypothetical protein
MQGMRDAKSGAGIDCHLALDIMFKWTALIARKTESLLASKHRVPVDSDAQ